MCFELTCGSAQSEDIHAMTDLATEIKRRTFLRYVNPQSLRELERDLGYKHGPGHLHIARDWSVNYFRSSYRGRPCVYLVWSGFEHIFV